MALLILAAAVAAMGLLRRKTGESITQDCNACHSLLAVDEAYPKILSDLGVVEAKH